MTKPERQMAKTVAGPLSLEIRNQRGLHARASAKFVTLANRYQATITVSKDGAEVIGTSIMGLLMLAAARGDRIEVRAEGGDAVAALQAIADLVSGRFGEE